jgi:hypothetical protein
MSWENAIHTILGGLIAGSVGLLIEIRRERKERRMKHFKDIKEKCLEPLFGKLDDLKKEFTFGESGPSWSRFGIEKLLKSDNPWWKTFSFKKAPVKYFFKAVEKNMILNKLEMGSYEILYEDLKNHYPELYRDLQELESLIKTKYEEFTDCSKPLKTIPNSRSWRSSSKSHM